MRLFIGIKASNELKKRVVAIQKKYKFLPVRFIKPENLHITLIAPWQDKTPEEAINKLRNIKFKKMRIVFDKVSIEKRSRVIWVECTNPPKEYMRLFYRISDMFHQRINRKLKVHLTIARFKDANSLRGIKLDSIQWEENIDNVTLFQSILDPTGAHYNTIFSIVMK